ncbi:ATP-grasp domain-containing protein [Roseicyclus mahoneyensis]|uniref:D-alanine-D-alanine ligase-like ATP-grasp enzyme n=1 Tax=Roseicyclus mahoneyensis TaxID=164332 RepID=A0A316GKN9_9RHOB|nr:ATP-grasp domain-containing protein [Roseicyclus mahoneyensis]PWK60558.1 D-alanine-D-alanine ligase-like ATP-grasp enzyme [Roseicyclus mahoneyensis]
MTKKLLDIGDKWNVHAGFQYGASTQTISGSLYVARKTVQREKFRSVVGQKIFNIFHNFSALEGDLTEADLLEAIFTIEQHFQQPTPKRGYLISKIQVFNGINYFVSLQTFNVSRTLKILKYIKQCCMFLSSPKNLQNFEKATREFVELAERERSRNSISVNNSRIVQFADSSSIPYRLDGQDIVRVGSGRHSHIFKSTITQSTSGLGVVDASSKARTGQLLERHFLPVPRKSIATDLAQAQMQAQKIGFPIAIKPDDGKQGRGVTAPVTHKKDLAVAFESAVRHGKRVVIEQFVPGKDYRITVDSGKIIKAIERRPGSITGDGIRTIKEILDDELTDFRKGLKKGKPVLLDDEASHLIKQAGYTLNTVLVDGLEVVLRRRANMSTGGTAYDVSELLHPDNAKLAIRAAEALMLDIAGVDLIAEDISRSWRETDVKILEVNAQPQISPQFVPDVYRDIIMPRLKGGTRARVALFVTDDWTADVQSAFEVLKHSLRTEWGVMVEQDREGLFRSGQWIAQPVQSGLKFVQNAEWDQSIDGILACPSYDELARHGMPAQFVDRILFYATRASDVNTNIAKILEILSKTADHVVEKDIKVSIVGGNLSDQLIAEGRKVGFRLYQANTS